MGNTERFGLSKIGPGEDIFGDGYKYTSADRDLIDSLLYLAVSGHVHDGTPGSSVNPDDPLDLELNTTGGSLPAGRRYYYTYTLVNQTSGIETIAAPEAFIDTPDPIDAPDRSILSFASTGGSQPPGQYFYSLTAWTDVNTNETNGGPSAGIIVGGNSTANEITVTFPSLPSGAQGFNIYRRKPGGRNYDFLASIDVVATSDTEYVDDGSVVADCDRVVPTRNTTNSTNSIDISLPGATPTVPVGYSWKIYRSSSSGNFSGGLLQWVVEETSEGSGVITPFFLDEGFGTLAGQPPAYTLDYANPSKVNLTDGAEVQGTLPMGMTAFPFEVSFFFGGALEVTTGTSLWVCEFPQADIVACRATLGRGFTPAADDVVVDVNKGTDDPSPSYSTIFTTQANRPTVPVGDQRGDRTTPDVISLFRGESLTVDVDQIGGGATPTDEDLTVTISMIVYGYPTTSYVEGSPGVGY